MIYAYTGLPGGGKTLSAMQDFLLPQLLKRRHVYANISGLCPMLIAARLDNPSDPRGRFTTSDACSLLHRFAMAFDDADARSRKEFWKTRPDGSRYYADAEGLGKLLEELMERKESVLILDECHEYLAPENWKLLRPFLKYLSMARHHGHDIVLITQHITDIWEPLRNRVHETHDFVRGRLGVKSRYRESVYHGWNVYADAKITRNRADDRSVYPLYGSHDGGAREHMRHMSIWQNRQLALYVLLFLLLASVSFAFLKRSASLYPSKSAPAAEAPPEHRRDSNIIYVRYVVCGAYDCKAARPDGSTLTLPLDYASGRYPIEVRKYAPQNPSFFGPGLSNPNPRPGVPHAPR